MWQASIHTRSDGLWSWTPHITSKSLGNAYNIYHFTKEKHTFHFKIRRTFVNEIWARYGHPIETEHESLHSFPSPYELELVSEEELVNCRLGYRARYALDAIHQVVTGNLDLNILFSYNDEQLIQELQKIHGVGKKVANCIALFAYGRMACVPIDIWISRAIENDCEGKSPFYLFNENAGIIQQYVFYYERHHQP